jgi:hypothetical protein
MKTKTKQPPNLPPAVSLPRVPTGGGFGGFLLPMNTKKCTGCNEEKPINEFGPQKLGKFGVTSKCRPCARRATSDWQKKNRSKVNEKLKRWRDENKERVIKYDRDYYAKNKEKRISSVISWQKRNPQSKLASNAIYRSKNQSALKIWRHKNKGIVYDHAKNRTISMRMATPPWLSIDDKLIIKAIYSASIRITKCTGIAHNVDHIHPLNHKLLCGLHVPSNLRFIPARLNTMKKNKIERGCY